MTVAARLIHRVIATLIWLLLLTMLVMVISSMGTLEVASIVDVSSVLLVVHHLVLMWKLATAIHHATFSRWTTLSSAIVVGVE